MREQTANKKDFIIIFLIIAISSFFFLLFGNNKLLFIAVSAITFFLAFKKPVYFLYLVFTWLVIRYMFSLQVSQFYFGGGGAAHWGKGDLFLNFLRIVSPDNYLIKHLPKVFFLASLSYIFHIKLNNKKNIMYDSNTKYISIFIIITVASAIANLEFFGLPFFLYSFLFPFVFYYYIKYLNLSLTRVKKLIFYILFLCFEIQISFTLIQNINSLLKGDPFFGDNAIGTFAFPMEESAVALLVVAFLFYLSRFFFKRNRADLIRITVIFIMVLFASVILTTMYLLVFLALYILLNPYRKKLKLNNFFYIVLFLIVLLPMLSFFISNTNKYAGANALKRLNKNMPSTILEINKVYSFVNLYDMVTNEGKYFLGSGPGTFLSAAGQKYKTSLYAKYNSWNIFRNKTMSSADTLENSFVGLVGEIGLLGWLMYIIFFFKLSKSTFSKVITNKYIHLIVFKNAVILYFIGLSFFRNIFENTSIISLVVTMVILIDRYLFIMYKSEMKND